MGTPDYVAPEQATDASTADIRADIYSLGCTLYFLLAGRPPFQESKPVETILAHLRKEPTPLGQLRTDLPAELWPVVARMLAKDPGQRFQEPAEVAEALAPLSRPGKKAGPAPNQATMLPAGASQVPLELPLQPARAVRKPAVPDQSPFANLEDASAPRTQPARTGRRLTQPVAVLAVLGLAAVLAVGAFFAFRSRTPDSKGPSVVEPTPEVQQSKVSAPADPIPEPEVPDPRRAFKTFSGDWRIEGDELVQGSAVQFSQVVFGDFHLERLRSLRRGETDHRSGAYPSALAGHR